MHSIAAIMKNDPNGSFFTRQYKNFFYNQSTLVGHLAQLARASALHAEGQGFESLNVHHRLVVCNRPRKWAVFLHLYLQSKILLL